MHAISRLLSIAALCAAAISPFIPTRNVWATSCRDALEEARIDINGDRKALLPPAAATLVPSGEDAVAVARSRVTGGLGIDSRNIGEARAGGMNVAMELRTPPGAARPATFPRGDSIPIELRGQAIDGWWVKIQKETTPHWIAGRDELAFREAREAYRGTGIEIMETHAVRLSDGNHAILQRRAPGKKVTEVLQDLFGDALGTDTSAEVPRIVLNHLLEPRYAPCFSGGRGVNLDYLCGELLDYGVDLGRVGAKLREPATRNLLDRLTTLRNVSETSPALAGTRKAMEGRGIGNRLFWMESRGLVTGLDLSVENFTVEMVGNEARIHVFDL